MSSERSVPLDQGLAEPTKASGTGNIAGELPVASDVTVRQPELPLGTRETAQKVGAAVGRAVVSMRQLPRRMSEMKQRFTVISGRTREGAVSSAEELRQNARQTVYQARSRAEHLAHEYPLQFIVGAGATAFVMGFALRIWRSSRRD